MTTDTYILLSYMLRRTCLASGEAIYLLADGNVVVGRDGCQPSGSITVMTGPWSYQEDEREVVQIIEDIMEANS